MMATARAANCRLDKPNPYSVASSFSRVDVCSVMCIYFAVGASIDRSDGVEEATSSGVTHGRDPWFLMDQNLVLLNH